MNPRKQREKGHRRTHRSVLRLVGPGVADLQTSQSKPDNEPVRLSLAERGQPTQDITPLFRASVLQTVREPLHGQVMVVMPPSAWIAAALSLLALLMLCVAAFIVEVPQRTRAVGVLMPMDGFMKIVATDAGQVVDVRVREREQVTSGQTLLSISADRGVIGRGPVSMSQLRSLQSERRLLEDANRERQRMQRQRGDAVDEQLGNVRLRIELTNREIDIQRSRVALSRSRFERLQRLAANGNVSPVQLDDEKLLLLQAEAASAVLQQQAAQNIAERDQLQRTQSGLADEAGVQQIEFAIAREQLQRQIVALEAEVSRELQAPEDGVVARLTVRAGQAVRAGETLMTLHRGGALQAWLYLSSANAGMLEEGQQVELRLDAWPHQMYGTRSATIVSISHSALLPSELDIPLAIAGPVFEVRATLQRQHVTARGKEWPLAAGTSFQADVVQRRYRLYEWLLRLRPDDTARVTSTDA
jgi:membrane fusion protein